MSYNRWKKCEDMVHGLKFDASVPATGEEFLVLG